MHLGSQPTLLLFIIISETTLFALYIYRQKLAYPILNDTVCSQQKRSSKISMLDSGWDQRAFALLRQTFQDLNNKKNQTRIVTFPIGGLTARVVISTDSWLWSAVETGNWEPNTYAAFMQYIASDTIVVDVGTWIGPTILFNSQLAARTYAIEADPVAFATTSYNLKQNIQSPWYSRVHLQAGCVGTESKLLEMKSAAPGNSMSSFHKIFREKEHSVTVNWTVQCYPLSAILKAWNINSEIEHVFIKIDIESYECQVLPSLYSWLAKMKRKPTLYIAMHQQIVACTEQQYAAIVKLAALYRFRSNKFIEGNGTVRGEGEYVLSDVIAPD